MIEMNPVLISKGNIVLNRIRADRLKWNEGQTTSMASGSQGRPSKIEILTTAPAAVGTLKITGNGKAAGGGSIAVNVLVVAS